MRNAPIWLIIFESPAIRGAKMKLESLNDLLLHELRDIYSAEKQLTKALPKMAKAAASENLRKAFEKHLVETNHQIERLEQIFEELALLSAWNITKSPLMAPPPPSPRFLAMAGSRNFYGKHSKRKKQPIRSSRNSRNPKSMPKRQWMKSSLILCGLSLL
jgi:hypothetical protein